MMPPYGILDHIRERSGHKDLDLPERIGMLWGSDGALDMTISRDSCRNGNMQDDENAFEGWAAAIYAYDRNVKIRLDIDHELSYDRFEGNGHLCRFLYRALRFSENYDWFSLGPNVEGHVSDFKTYIESKSNIFINNMPKGKAGTKTAHDKESAKETELAEAGVLAERLGGKIDVGNNTVSRQLPIGIFKDVVKSGAEIFPGRKAAIDLWTWNGPDLYIIELKADNRKIGIISEIFFYAHCMADLILPGGSFKLNKEKSRSGKDDRGYSELLAHSSEFDKIHGLMLADGFHPLVNDEILAVLNSGRDPRIMFHTASYR